MDADLRFALENRPVNDIVGRCLVYVHKVVNAKGEKEKVEMNLQSEVTFIHHFVRSVHSPVVTVNFGNIRFQSVRNCAINLFVTVSCTID